MDRGAWSVARMGETSQIWLGNQARHQRNLSAYPFLSIDPTAGLEHSAAHNNSDRGDEAARAGAGGRAHARRYVSGEGCWCVARKPRRFPRRLTQQGKIKPKISRTNQSPRGAGLRRSGNVSSAGRCGGALRSLSPRRTAALCPGPYATMCSS